LRSSAALDREQARSYAACWRSWARGGVHCDLLPLRGMLTVTRLSKSYGNRSEVLRNVDLELGAGDYVAIMGESGSGKSTLLNLLAGIDVPQTGHVTIDGISLFSLNEDARARLRARKFGFVFQAFHLLPHLTVAQNAALPLVLQGLPADAIRRRLQPMLEAVDLARRAESFPRELSGGEMQRVAIARALIHQPQVVLADEPTGNLDVRNAGQILALLRRQIKDSKAAGILVTHSAKAAESADRIYTLSDGELRPADAAPERAANEAPLSRGRI
jgi:putative ABC transport system ATP-binding protein